MNDTLNLNSNRNPRLSWVNVRELVDEVRASLSGQLTAQGIGTEMDVPRTQNLLADRTMLQRALTNLSLNALDAMPEGGTLVYTSYQGPYGLELEVADSGPGLDDQARKRAFEPFFTTKRGASGLGLAIVQRIAQVHGGDVVATNCPEGGAAFTLRIPLLFHGKAAA